MAETATPEEVHRVRLLECERQGHSFEVGTVVHRADPQLVLCARCGESWPMAHIGDEALAQIRESGGVDA